MYHISLASGALLVHHSIVSRISLESCHMYDVMMMIHFRRKKLYPNSPHSTPLQLLWFLQIIPCSIAARCDIGLFQTYSRLRCDADADARDPRSTGVANRIGAGIAPFLFFFSSNFRFQLLTPHSCCAREAYLEVGDLVGCDSDHCVRQDLERYAVGSWNTASTGYVLSGTRRSGECSVATARGPEYKRKCRHHVSTRRRNQKSSQVKYPTQKFCKQSSR